MRILDMLNLLAARAHLAQNLIDADFINSLHRPCRNAQGDELALGRNPKALIVKVRLETPLRFIIGVRNTVSRHRPLAGDLTYLCHSSIVSVLTPRTLHELPSFLYLVDSIDYSKFFRC